MAGLGAVVENACPGVSNAADIVVPSNDNDGSAILIEKLLVNGDNYDIS